MPQSMVDPEIATFVAMMADAWAAHPPFQSLPISEARAIAEIVRAPWRAGGPETAHTHELMVATAP